MIYKKREKPHDLQILEFLDRRMELQKEADSYYYSLNKGYEGELSFDRLIETLPDHYIILGDLLLRTNNTVFQIDTLVITKEEAIIYEVKNYEGEYTFDDDHLKNLSSKRTIINPLVQLSRTKALLSQLIDDLGFNFSVKGYVMFINQKFTLYRMPEKKNILLSSNISNHLNQLKAKGLRDNQQKLFAKKLYKLHLPSSPYHNLPNYEFSSLKKEIFCPSCKNPLTMENTGRKYVCCDGCGHRVLSSEIILDQVKEFKLLFPDKVVTTAFIQEFCGDVFSKQRIRAVLQKNLRVKGNNRATHYV